MTISNKISRIALAAIIVVSLCISAFYLNTKQGYHEDELLTYNLANSSKQLNIGGWNTPEDMNEYLAVYPEHRFDYAQVVQNQIIDASHPPFYYALVHTVCSFFPEVFSKWLAFVMSRTTTSTRSSPSEGTRSASPVSPRRYTCACTPR